VPESVTTSEPAIDVREATKTFSGRVHALRGVTLAVGRGEIFGLLGPNGAGKSTLVKILLTIVRPTRCEGTMLGRPIGDRAALARVGYLPEHLRFPEYLTAAQAIEYFGALSLVPRAERKRRAGELLDLVGMGRWANSPIRTFSKGMRQRTGLAVALVADPDLVVLDEPTDGVDPVGRKEIRDVLLEIRRRGKTVLLNTHILAEVEGICDRVAIMNKGRVVRQGTIGELSRGDRRYEFTVRGAPDDALRNRLAALLAEPPPPPAPLAPWTFTLPGAGPDEAQPVLDLLRSAGLAVEAMRPIRSSLEDIFMDTVREDGGGGPGAVTGRDA
jgi:ABC-2 type transport system ATP-binding protein